VSTELVQKILADTDREYERLYKEHEKQQRVFTDGRPRIKESLPAEVHWRLQFRAYTTALVQNLVPVEPQEK
jgi:hypothetical protein